MQPVTVEMIQDENKIACKKLVEDTRDLHETAEQLNTLILEQDMVLIPTANVIEASRVETVEATAKLSECRPPKTPFLVRLIGGAVVGTGLSLLGMAGGFGCLVAGCVGCAIGGAMR